MGLRLCLRISCHRPSCEVGSIHLCLEHLSECEPQLVAALTEQQIAAFGRMGCGQPAATFTALREAAQHAVERKLLELQTPQWELEMRKQLNWDFTKRRWPQRKLRKLFWWRKNRRLQPQKPRKPRGGRKRIWPSYREAHRAAQSAYCAREFVKLLSAMPTWSAEQLSDFRNRLEARWKIEEFCSRLTTDQHSALYRFEERKR